MTMEWYGAQLIASENASTRAALKLAAEMVLAKAVAVTPEETGMLLVVDQIQHQLRPSHLQRL